MRYTIRIARDARKALAALSPEIKRRITLAIDGLAVEPRPQGATALAGRSGLLRIRVGDYRVVYGVNDVEVRVTVIRLGQRREVYRGL